MVGFVPISNEDSEVIGRGAERDRDQRPAEDLNATEGARGLVEAHRREVEEAPDLILHLEDVREVVSRWDRACCPVDTILV